MACPPAFSSGPEKPPLTRLLRSARNCLGTHSSVSLSSVKGHRFSLSAPGPVDDGLWRRELL